MSVISRNDTLGLELFPVQSFCISVLIIGIRYGESLYKTWTMSPLLKNLTNLQFNVVQTLVVLKCKVDQTDAWNSDDIADFATSTWVQLLE